jgi:hypothetical protein
VTLENFKKSQSKIIPQKMAIHDDDTSSRKLWIVQETPDGGRRASKVHHLVWSETPDAANKLAVAFWGQFDKRWMDGLDNIDGSSTEPGQCYQGFACVDCGAGSVFLSVEQVDTDPWFLGTNALKKALKSRRLDCGTDGAKGDAARRLLASRLQGYISVAKQKPEEKGAGASVGLTSSPSSSSSSSSSAVGGAATSSIDVASPEQPEPKKIKLDCFSKLATDLGCPPDCYLVAVLHDELTFHVVSKAEKKVLRSLFMPWVFFKEDGTTVGTAKPDVENIYNDAYLQDARLSGDTYLILKQFVLAHCISSDGFVDLEDWEEFTAEGLDGVPPHLDWMEAVNSNSDSRVFGDIRTAVRKIS